MQTKLQRTPPTCEGEEWVRISYPYERYFLSNKGRLYTPLKGILSSDYGGSHARRMCVRLFYKGKLKRFYLHRLVARYFCPDWYEGCEVDHIDGDWTNNAASNLRCLTPTQHRKQTIVQGLKSTNFGIVENGKLIDIISSRSFFLNDYKVTAPNVCIRRRDHKKLKYINLPAGCMIEIQQAMQHGDSLQKAFFEYCIRLSEYGRKQE